jgi:hypothetical protein
VPDESSAKLDELNRTLDAKLFSQIDDEIPHTQQDAAMAQSLRTPWEDLWKTYQKMKRLYDHPRREIPGSTSRRFRRSGTGCLRRSRPWGNLDIPVPGDLTILLTTRVTDGSSQTIMTRIVPGHVQAHIMHGRGRLSRRVPINSRPGPHRTLRDRSTARDWMRSNRLDNR